MTPPGPPEMDATTTPHNPVNTPAAGSPVVPMLRAVLVCDIVESTALVERLGDLRAVLLMQRHDQLLRQALQQSGGQLIDRADGVLALFERPIGALDFALRYQRALRELGEGEGTALMARIGIHVGDVMMWANEPKDVLAGAKPFEVEGLAKPVAARLMGLALPGQILMSGMAQNLAQRAAAELGERAAKLRWLVHGRYRFKGVPAPMIVHEVGEAGVAPLRAPESGAKAWRELPLWRRPPVLAAEALVLGVLASFGLWSALRAPPAIAFAERDWVVVADLQNRTAEPLFDDALDTALRVGLEQSRHVNLVSEIQVERALQRMQRADEGVSRDVATEVALREGARAVILPTVASVGGTLRVSLEVIDPNSGVTVYSEAADATGTDQVLPAIDQAVAAVRGRLGETIASIEGSSQPLEQVTTADLEALRLFSLGVQARSRGRPAEAAALFRQAIERDPEFSMAWLRLGATELGNDLDLAESHFRQAATFRDRLTRREQLLLDATLGLMGPPVPMLEKWRNFALLYPDEYRAYYNYSFFAHFTRHQFAEAANFIRPALVPQNPQRAAAHYMAGAALLADNQVDAAEEQFGLAASLGLEGPQREFADAHAAQRDYAAARARIVGKDGTQVPAGRLRERLGEVAWPLDQGDWATARQALAALAADLDKAPLDTRLQQRLMAASLRAYEPDAALAGELGALAGDLAQASDGANPLRRPQLDFLSLGTAWIAAHTGTPALAEAIVARVAASPGVPGFTYNEDMLRVVQAELDLGAGRPAAAVERLAPRAGEADALLFLRAVLMRAHAAAGDPRAALAEAEWLAGQRGKAYGEPTADNAWMLANLVEVNLALQHAAWLAAGLGDTRKADALQAQFDRAWAAASGSAAVLRRRPSS